MTEQDSQLAKLAAERNAVEVERAQLTVELDIGDTDSLEAEVRLYSRKFPKIFSRSKNAEMFDSSGNRYIDFFCGAGALNYGHNNDTIKRMVIQYLTQDGIMHGLDMKTVIRQQFIRKFHDTILKPRGLNYKVQFCGPTGADAVEAAIKLARKVTGRDLIIAFTGAYHGMSRGALSVTGGVRARAAGRVHIHNTSFVPFEVGPEGSFDSVGYIERLLLDASSGHEKPAAIILEPLQMEGGIYLASSAWLQRLRDLANRHGILLICDEIQTGCGRTGPFFCFEGSQIVPDIVTVSKSISGYGFPMSLLLFKRELDVWEPGEHTGTFRGNQLAFVSASAALDFWQDADFKARIDMNGESMRSFGLKIQKKDSSLRVRGQGAVLGIDTGPTDQGRRAARIQEECFNRGLIVELCGRDDEVVKIMPPINIDTPTLNEGFAILQAALEASA
ncbi:diaminobutyrate--2-oxoglutarate transaminase [Rhizobium sp. NPDC090279]|uniref:diaminobutyrate--2-oxoglutarate transaminase n=1 Tax=Rhizobium sp. NPDC090279 TaxID=3364499 RepID=UPI003839FE42